MRALFSEIVNGPYSQLVRSNDLVINDNRTMSPREFGRKIVGRKVHKKNRGKKR